MRHAVSLPGMDVLPLYASVAFTALLQSGVSPNPRFLLYFTY